MDAGYTGPAITLLIDKIRKKLDTREISVRELTDAYIGRIDKYNGDNGDNGDNVANRDNGDNENPGDGGKADTRGGLNAYLHVNREGIADAIAAAQALIDAGQQSPLTGIPIAISDDLCTVDMPTTCASHMLDGYRPPYDATVVDRLRAQGAIFLGKLNIDEFSMGTSTQNSYYGRVRNPYDPSRVPGGSSGGAAAAVAAGLCVAAIGTDAGGSVSRPASFCGVTGFRPTYGLVSRHGCAAYASCYDQAGPVAAGAADCAAILETIAGYCRYDLTTSINKQKWASGKNRYEVDIKGLKLGLIRELFSEAADPRVREAAYEAAKWFEQAGATIIELSIPMLPRGAAAFHLLACAEASANLARIDGIRFGRRARVSGDYFDIVSRSRGEGLGKEVKKQILFGTCVLNHEYYDRYYKQAINIASIIRTQYDEALQKADALLSPAAPNPAYPAAAGLHAMPSGGAPGAPGAGTSTPAHTEINPDIADIYSVGPSIAGLPSVSMPCGYIPNPDAPPDGVLPVGLMITGRRFADAFTLGLAHAYERDFKRMAPPLADGWKGY